MEALIQFLFQLMIKISKQLFGKIENKALDDLPYEACGLLLGSRATDYITISDVAFSENVSEDNPTRSFEIDPSLYVKLQKQARAGGPDIIGVWHSHPNGNPIPSETDKERSVECNWVWLITGTIGDACQTKGHLSGSDTPSVFTEVEIELTG